jgi:hypothetical protein
MATNTPSEVPTQFILLGASNLARARYGIQKYLEKIFASDSVSTLIASGPGRAYCVTGGIFLVNYHPLKNSPAINLGRYKSLEFYQTVALISDIGNDIMYGVPVQKIIRDLDKLIHELSHFCSHVFVIPIPCKKIEQLSNWKINLLKKLLFPKSQLSPENIISSVHAINHFLSQLQNPRVTVLETMDDSIGWDHVHYGIFKMHTAWAQIIAQITKELPNLHNGRINQALMFRSFIDYWKNIIFRDIIPIISKGQKFY